MGAVKFVMYENLLFWMEVMNVLGKAHEMFGILTQALAWPGMEVCPQVVYCNTCLMLGGQTLDLDNELTSFIRDALRFISAFMVPISESAPHIYLYPLFHFPLSILLLPTSSVQGFPIRSRLLKAGQLNGR